ncbi:Subtilase-type proteinase RRT12 [Diplonema papillatum]|nr:Subtilase-type proteinase RRT12 [Diplonema papillatum]
MIKWVAAAAAVALSACRAEPAADEFVLVVREDAPPGGVEALLSEQRRRSQVLSAGHAPLAGAAVSTLLRVAKKVRGILVHMTEAQAKQVVEDHPDTVMKLARNEAVTSAAVDVSGCSRLQTAPRGSWHLQNLYQKSAVLGTQHGVNPDWGRGVDIHVMDSGVRCDHEQFGDRCEVLYAMPGTNIGSHATSVASLAAGGTLSAAPKARILSTQTLNEHAAGTITDAVNALSEIYDHEAARTDNKTAVVNLSLYAESDSTGLIIPAVANLINLGVVVVAAQGNAGDTRCLNVFAKAEGVINVAASGVYRGAAGAVPVESISSFSCAGTCIDIVAPGNDIFAAAASGTQSYGFLYGTSLSSPLVAGMAAAYIGSQPDGRATRQQVLEWLTSNSRKGLTNAAALSTVDRIAHMPCTTVEPPTAGLAVPENCYNVFETTTLASNRAYTLSGGMNSTRLFCHKIRCANGYLSHAVNTWLDRGDVLSVSTDAATLITLRKSADFPSFGQLVVEREAVYRYSSLARTSRYQSEVVEYSITATCTAKETQAPVPTPLPPLSPTSTPASPSPPAPSTPGPQTAPSATGTPTSGTGGIRGSEVMILAAMLVVASLPWL